MSDGYPTLTEVPLWGSTRNGTKIHRVADGERGLGELAVARCGRELTYVWKASGRFRPSVNCQRCA